MFLLSKRNQKRKSHSDTIYDSEKVAFRYVEERKIRKKSRILTNQYAESKLKLEEETKEKEILLLKVRLLQSEPIFSQILLYLCESIIQNYVSMINAEPCMSYQCFKNHISQLAKNKIDCFTEQEWEHFLKSWIEEFSNYLYGVFRTNIEFIHTHKKIRQENVDILAFLYYCVYPVPNSCFLQLFLPRWLARYNYSLDKWIKQIANFVCNEMLLSTSMNKGLCVLQMELRKKMDQWLALSNNELIRQDIASRKEKEEKERKEKDPILKDELETELHFFFSKQKLSLFPFLDLLRATPWNYRLKIFTQKNQDFEYSQTIMKKLANEVIEEEKMKILKQYLSSKERKEKFFQTLIQYEIRINILLVFVLFISSLDEKKEWSIFLGYGDLPTDFYRLQLLFSADSGFPTLHLISNFPIEIFRKWSIQVHSSFSSLSFQWEFPMIVDYCSKWEKKIQFLFNLFLELNVITPIILIILNYFIKFKPNLYQKNIFPSKTRKKLKDYSEMSEWVRLTSLYIDGKEMNFLDSLTNNPAK